MDSRRLCSIAILISCFVASLQSQSIKSLEFKDQEIKDVLIVLAQLSNVSIIPDDTVKGRCSFYFANMDFDTALQLFTESNNLTFIKKEKVYYVSRIYIEYFHESGLISVRGTDVPVRSLLSMLMLSVGKTILYDTLPSESISIVAKDLSLQEILSLVIAKNDNYTLENKNNYFYLKKKDSVILSRQDNQSALFTVNNNLFSIQADRARFRDTLSDLFLKANKEFVLLSNQDGVLESLNYQNKTFDDILKLLLIKASSDFSISKGIYIIFDVQKNDLQNQFLTTLIVPLQYISTTDLQRLLPSNLNTNNKVRFDDRSNRVVLNGLLAEIRPIFEFISLVDVERIGNTTIRIDLSFLKADEVIPILPFEYSSFTPVALPSKTGFLISVPERKIQKLYDFVKLVDKQDQGVPIRLNFIKAEELLANLPPSVSDQMVKKTTDSSIVFFKGSEEVRSRFLRDLATIDHPKAQIKYQLLVLEVEDTDSSTWKAGLNVGRSDSRIGSNLLQGQFQGAFNFSFNVIPVLGYALTASLQWQMGKNKARVIADTTLQALSGEKITFKNTTTVRIKDTEVTTGTTTVTTSVVREISSGLILNMEGWVSGSRMITMKIDSTLSKTIEGSSESSLPTTTEKIFNSLVRTEVGTPISVTGLKQQQIIENTQKVPILGSIPLLGWLFTYKTKSLTNTDYLIYIIPRLELPEVNRNIMERSLVENYYRYLFHQKNSDAQP